MNIEKVKSWFNSDHFPRWWVFAGALASVVANQSLEAWRRHADRKEQIIVQFQSSTTELQVVLAAYVDAVLDEENQRIQSSQDQLRRELLSLQDEIDFKLDTFDTRQRSAALEYRESMQELNLILAVTESYETLGEFWSAAAKVIETRDSFLESLKTS